MTVSTDPLVTIGVPTYERAEYLPRALDHIVGQTYSNLEIVVSDNASTDETPEICRRYADKDDRIRVVRQKDNLGPLTNMRFLLNEARGKYFMWHADDDYLAPSFVEKAVSVLEKDPEVLACCCDYVQVDEQDTVTSRWTMEHLYPDTPWQQGQMDFFRHPYTRSTMAIYALYRREVLEDISNIPSATGSVVGWEAPFLARIAAHGRVVAIPERLFTYNNHRLKRDALAHTVESNRSTWEKGRDFLSKQARILHVAFTANVPMRRRLRLAGTCVKATVWKIIDELRDTNNADKSWT